MTAPIGIGLLICLFTCDLFGNEGDPVNIHGFISQGYLQSTRNDIIQDSTDGTWQFNEFGLNFGYKPIDKLLISLQLMARDFGSVGNDEIMIDFAFADYSFRDELGIRAGKMKCLMGLYSETRDVDMLRTSVFLPASVYDELLRDTENYIQGVGIYGFLNTDSLGSVSYQAQAGTCNLTQNTSTVDYLETGMMDINSVNMDTSQSYALQYTDPSGMFRFGGTALFTQIDVDAVSGTTDLARVGFGALGISPGSPIIVKANGIEIYTASAEVIWRNIVLSGEIKNTKTNDLILYHEEKEIYRRQMNQIGYYGMLTYQFNDRIDAGVSYEEFYPYKNDRNGYHPEPGNQKEDHWMKKWAYSIKLSINPNWLIKYELQYIDGTAGLIYEENRFAKRYWFVNAAKLTYNF